MSILLILVLVFLFMTLVFALVMVLALGGKALRQMIASKMPWNKNKCVWVLYFTNDRKLKWKLKVLPPDYFLKVKNGAQKHDDQHVYLPQAYHLKDSDGTPVYIAMEDLPIGVLFKKFRLTREIKQVGELIELCNLAMFKRNTDNIETLKVAIKRVVGKIYGKIAFLGKSKRVIKNIIATDLMIDETNGNPKFTGIKLVEEYRRQLVELREGFYERNNTFVNIYDLFTSIGITKHISKLIYMSWQNGYMAAKQTLGNDKKDYTTIIAIGVVGLLVLVCGFLVYQQGKTITEMQTQVVSMKSQVLDMKKVMTGDVSSTDQQVEVVDLTNAPEPSPTG